MPARLAPTAGERWACVSRPGPGARGRRASGLRGRAARREASLAADLEKLLGSHDALREGFLDDALLRAQPPASLAGQVLGAYALVSPIGRGGMGSVWLAERSDGRFADRSR